ncbi:hypothetical protein [Veillonella sp.]
MISFGILVAAIIQAAK